MLSPVGNPELWKFPAPKGYVGGRFRANWQYGFNVTPSGTSENKDKEGEETIAKLSAGIAQVTGAAGIHYIVNNLPYAQALEYGHSTQAAAGMVGITQVKFRGIVEAAARSVNP
jgi:hypothetical protein